MAMKLEQILMVISLGLLSCKCIYQGSYSKVIWNPEKKSYVQSAINLGEDFIFPEFEKCNKTSEKLVLKGRINNRSTLYENKKLNLNILILKCDEKGLVKDTIAVTEKDGYFSFVIKREKKHFLVFKEKDKKEGIRFDITSFK